MVHPFEYIPAECHQTTLSSEIKVITFHSPASTTTGVWGSPPDVR